MQMQKLLAFSLFLVGCGGEAFTISKEYINQDEQPRFDAGLSSETLATGKDGSTGYRDNDSGNANDHLANEASADDRTNGADSGTYDQSSGESDATISQTNDASRDRQTLEASPGPPSCTQTSTIYASPECNDWIRSFGDTWTGCCLTNPAFTCGVVVAGGCRYYQTPPPSQ